MNLKVIISRQSSVVSRPPFRTWGFHILLLLLTANCSLLTVQAHGGEDHGEKKTTGAAGAKTAATVARAERNLQTESGQFNARLERSPADPRTGELVQIALKLAEKVEGGFGGSDPLALEDAIVSLNVTTADGLTVADNLPVTFEKGFYRVDYTFNRVGNFKIVFDVNTADKRRFAVDFPVTVSAAPINWLFWLGTFVLGLISLGAIAAVFYTTRKGENRNGQIRRIAPFVIAAVLFFTFGTIALAYFEPPREQRATINFEPTGELPAIQTAAGGTTTNITVSKESQLLFGIKTAPVEIRKIASGLKVTGTVRARPDAKAVIVPPVAGRVVFRQNLALGSAVTRGENIGTVEQILDVSGQVELESQRLEVESQQREIEAKRLELRNTVLALQGQQAEQRANANQARTRLAQAQRELRRSQNLVDVGAVPQKRVEEANTAVKVAEQEVAAAEKQAGLLENQIRQAQAGQSVFRQPRVNQPSRAFPLTAPITGIINEIRATSGQQVETGTELLSIVNLSTVLIEANVFERDLPAVRESTKASFTSPALNNEVYTIGTADGDGRLVSTGQTVDPQTRAVPVIYEVKNPFGRLRDGNFVEVTIDTGGNAQTLAVPKQAVVNEQGQTFVFVYIGGENFERRAVVLGAEGADYSEVKTGLKEGERVVTEGVYQLRSTEPGA